MSDVICSSKRYSENISALRVKFFDKQVNTHDTDRNIVCPS